MVQVQYFQAGARHTAVQRAHSIIFAVPQIASRSCVPVLTLASAQAVFRGLVKQIQKQQAGVPADVHAEFARLDPE